MSEEIIPPIIYSNSYPYVFCPYCQATFITDPMDATCRFCSQFFREMKHLGDTDGPLLKEISSLKSLLAQETAHAKQTEALLQEREEEIESDKHCYNLLAKHSEKQHERIATLEEVLRDVPNPGNYGSDHFMFCKVFGNWLREKRKPALAARPEAGDE